MIANGSKDFGREDKLNAMMEMIYGQCV